jgi:protein gp37
MAGVSNIEWTEHTWNPFAGCAIVSPGCTNCYAMKMAARLDAMGQAVYKGLTKPSKAGPVWRGTVRRASDDVLLAPLRRKKPTTYFVNSMSDLFYELFSDDLIDQVFAVMALCPQHTFQVLTKRAKRMREYVARGPQYASLDLAVWPLPNVWLGVSAERQQEADERIPLLLQTPAAVRFVSAEPLIGPIDFSAIPVSSEPRADRPIFDPPALHWVIVGGESGQHARPMEAAWAQSIRDQCEAAGVAYFFKQWGAWIPEGQTLANGRKVVLPHDSFEHARPGKKAAGRLLDGIEHNEFPNTQSAPALLTIPQPHKQGSAL